MTNAQYIEARTANVAPAEPTAAEIEEIQEIYAQEMWEADLEDQTDPPEDADEDEDSGGDNEDHGHDDDDSTQHGGQPYYVGPLKFIIP